MTDLRRPPLVLLILPTSSYRVADFLDAAGAIGVEVAVAAEQHLPLLDPGRFVQIDCSQPAAAAEAVVDFASTAAIDAIIPVDDAGVVVAALAAERLGLSHNPPAAAAATRNKAALRRALAAAEVPQPSFGLVGPDDDPTDLAAAIGFPMVAKPLSLSGSRGVIKVDDPTQLAAVLERIRLINLVAGRDPQEPLLLETFMSGPEVAVEGILWTGRLETLAVFDKPDPLDGPYFEETIYVTPSRLHPEMLEEVERVAGAATAAIGLTEGPVHIELRVTGDRVRVIEVAARSIGGVCGRALRFGLLGSSLETMILRHAIGRRERIRRHPGATGVMMLPIDRPGTLVAIEGVEAALATDGINSIEITSPPGSELRPVPDADRYLGFMFATGANPEEVVATLHHAHGHLRVVLDDPK